MATSSALSVLWRVVRFAAAAVTAVVVASLLFFLIATGNDGWRFLVAMLVGGLVGGMAFTAVKDGPRALLGALVRGRAIAGSRPTASRARRAPRR